MGVLARWPTWYVLVCPECRRQRDLFCHDHAEPVKVEAVEVVPAEQLRGAVEENERLREGGKQLDGVIQRLVENERLREGGEQLDGVIQRLVEENEKLRDALDRLGGQ